MNFHRRKNNSKAQNKFPTPNFRWVHPDHTLVRACILHYVAYKICVYIRNFIHTYTHKRNKSHGIFSGDFHNLRAHCGGGVFRLGGSEILLHIFPEFSRFYFYFWTAIVVVVVYNLRCFKKILYKELQFWRKVVQYRIPLRI